MTNLLRLTLSLGILASLTPLIHGQSNPLSIEAGAQSVSRTQPSGPVNYFPTQPAAPSVQPWPAPYPAAPYQAPSYYYSAGYPPQVGSSATLGPGNLGATGPLEIESGVHEAWRNFRSPVDRVGIQLGVLGLVRERPDNQILAYNENSQPILSASDLQGSMQFGVNAMLDVYNVHHALGGTDLQFGYFGINSLDSQQDVTAGEVDAVFFNGRFIDPPPDFTFLYSSNLYSGEANLRFMSRSRIRPIVGLRFLKFEDQYDVYRYAQVVQVVPGVPSVPGVTVVPTGESVKVGGFSKTNNHMFGGQFGAEADVWRVGRTRWYASGKFSTMYNQVDGSALAADVDGNTVEKYYGDKHFATLVDAGTGLEYGFAGPLSFRVGYRALLASGVATGLDQNQSIRILSPGETVVFGSQQWHGIDLAATLSF